jgi:hypothetical protein
VEARFHLARGAGPGLGLPQAYKGVQVCLATGLRSSWTQAWPAFRDYS